MSDQPYQALPPLSDEEYAALREDIRVHGQMVPILIDEDGNILDGHNRNAICLELGIKPRFEVLDGLDAQAKWDTALRLNNNRRHLSLAQRQEMVQNELRRDPSRTDRTIASLLGVDHKTVARHRHLLFDPPDVVIPDPRRFPNGLPTKTTEDYPFREDEWDAPSYEDYILWCGERTLAYYQAIPDLGAKHEIVDIAVLAHHGLPVFEMLDWNARPQAAQLWAQLKRVTERAKAACQQRLDALDEAACEAEWAEHEAAWEHTEWNEWNWRGYFLQVLREGPSAPEPEAPAA